MAASGVRIRDCVRDEPLHFFGGLFLRVEALLDACQHGVQRHGQRADLCAFRQVWHTLLRSPAAIFARSFNPLQGRERALHQNGAEYRADQHHRDATIAQNRVNVLAVSI